MRNDPTKVNSEEGHTHELLIVIHQETKAQKVEERRRKEKAKAKWQGMLGRHLSQTPQIEGSLETIEIESEVPATIADV